MAEATTSELRRLLRAAEEKLEVTGGDDEDVGAGSDADAAPGVAAEDAPAGRAPTAGWSALFPTDRTDGAGAAGTPAAGLGFETWVVVPGSEVATGVVGAVTVTVGVFGAFTVTVSGAGAVTVTAGGAGVFTVTVASGMVTAVEIAGSVGVVTVAVGMPIAPLDGAATPATTPIAPSINPRPTIPTALPFIKIQMHMQAGLKLADRPVMDSSYGLFKV